MRTLEHGKLSLALDSFIDALEDRLALRAEQGKDGWDETTWKDECLAKMIQSAADQDPLDTAGYAVFAHYHGWGKNAS